MATMSSGSAHLASTLSADIKSAVHPLMKHDKTIAGKVTPSWWKSEVGANTWTAGSYLGKNKLLVDAF
jgi:hypothetical protein